MPGSPSSRVFTSTPFQPSQTSAFPSSSSFQVGNQPVFGKSKIFFEIIVAFRNWICDNFFCRVFGHQLT